MERTTVQLDKNSQERRAQRTKLLFVGILMALVVVAALVAFLRKKEFQVTDVQVTGTQSLDSADIASLVKKSLEGNRWFVIPRSNALLLSKFGLRATLLSDVPTLADVAVGFAGRNTLLVSVTEKSPSYVWCKDAACFFVDDKGVLYGDAPLFSDGVYVTLSGGVVDQNHPAGSAYLGTEAFTALRQILGVLADYPTHVLGVEVRDNGDIAIRVDSIKGNQVNPRSLILVTKTDTTQSIYDAMTLVMGDKAFTESLETKGDLLEYVDLRFPGKIYYKFSS